MNPITEETRQLKVFGHELVLKTFSNGQFVYMSSKPLNQGQQEQINKYLIAEGFIVIPPQTDNSSDGNYA